MKFLIYTLIFVVFLTIIIKSLIIGIDREAQHQCLVAKYHCELYADAGACDQKYMKVCEGVEDDE